MVDLNSFAFQPGLLDLRWRFVTDAGGSFPPGEGGWWIDDIEIVGGSFTCTAEGNDVFGQTVLAADRDSLFWDFPENIHSVAGALDGLSEYSILAQSSLPGATSLDISGAQPPPFDLTWFLVRGTCQSWQTEQDAEPARDLFLNAPPIAQAQTLDTTCVGPEARVTVNGDASTVGAGGGAIQEYSWDCGNGQVLFGSEVTCTYPTPGSTTIRLSTIDQCGRIGLDELVVVVPSCP